jgi:calcineurin-like phosphoesterase family protein
MTYWVIADTHFGHEKMLETCDRPLGFEERILKNIQRVVRKEDIMIHLGDVCFGKDAFWNSSLYSVCAGKQWLLKGNHDPKTNGWYYKYGWDCVAHKIELNVFGERVILSHRPMKGKGNYINVHGHLHNTRHHEEEQTDDRHRLVYMEHHYTPIDLRKIIERSKKKGYPKGVG